MLCEAGAALAVPAHACSGDRRDRVRPGLDCDVAGPVLRLLTGTRIALFVAVEIMLGCAAIVVWFLGTAVVALSSGVLGSSGGDSYALTITPLGWAVLTMWGALLVLASLWISRRIYLRLSRTE